MSAIVPAEVLMRTLHWIIRPRLFFWITALYTPVLMWVFGEEHGLIVDLLVSYTMAVLLQIVGVCMALIAAIVLYHNQSSWYVSYTERIADSLDGQWNPQYRWYEMFTGAPHFTLKDIRNQAKSYTFVALLCVLMPVEFVSTVVCDLINHMRRRLWAHVKSLAN